MADDSGFADGQEDRQNIVIVVEEGEWREVRAYHLRRELDLPKPTVVFTRPVTREVLDREEVGEVEQKLILTLFDIPGIGSVLLMSGTVKIVKHLAYGWPEIREAVAQALRDAFGVERFYGPVPAKDRPAPPPPKRID